MNLSTNDLASKREIISGPYENQSQKTDSCGQRLQQLQSETPDFFSAADSQLKVTLTDSYPIPTLNNLLPTIADSTQFPSHNAMLMGLTNHSGAENPDPTAARTKKPTGKRNRRKSLKLKGYIHEEDPHVLIKNTNCTIYNAGAKIESANDALAIATLCANINGINNVTMDNVSLKCLENERKYLVKLQWGREILTLSLWDSEISTGTLHLTGSGKIQRNAIITHLAQFYKVKIAVQIIETRSSKIFKQLTYNKTRNAFTSNEDLVFDFTELPENRTIMPKNLEQENQTSPKEQGKPLVNQSINNPQATSKAIEELPKKQEGSPSLKDALAPPSIQGKEDPPNSMEEQKSELHILQQQTLEQQEKMDEMKAQLEEKNRQHAAAALNEQAQEFAANIFRQREATALNERAQELTANIVPEQQKNTELEQQKSELHTLQQKSREQEEKMAEMKAQLEEKREVEEKRQREAAVLKEQQEFAANVALEQQKLKVNERQLQAMQQKLNEMNGMQQHPKTDKQNSKFSEQKQKTESDAPIKEEKTTNTNNAPKLEKVEQEANGASSVSQDASPQASTQKNDQVSKIEQQLMSQQQLFAENQKVQQEILAQLQLLKGQQNGQTSHQPPRRDKNQIRHNLDNDTNDPNIEKMIQQITTLLVEKFTPSKTDGKTASTTHTFAAAIIKFITQTLPRYDKVQPNFWAQGLLKAIAALQQHKATFKSYPSIIQSEGLFLTGLIEKVIKETTFIGEGHPYEGKSLALQLPIPTFFYKLEEGTIENMKQERDAKRPKPNNSRGYRQHDRRDVRQQHGGIGGTRQQNGQDHGRSNNHQHNNHNHRDRQQQQSSWSGWSSGRSYNIK